MSRSQVVGLSAAVGCSDGRPVDKLAKDRRVEAAILLVGWRFVHDCGDFQEWRELSWMMVLMDSISVRDGLLALI